MGVTQVTIDSEGGGWTPSSHRRVPALPLVGRLHSCDHAEADYEQARRHSGVGASDLSIGRGRVLSLSGEGLEAGRTSGGSSPGRRQSRT
jgi:hypothetical protein